MSLQTKLEIVIPRENAGSSSSNRFDYQKNWAICKLIELSQNDIDFLLTFEYHDDIIIFDSSLNPSKIDFFQIKTSKTKFNLKRLLSQKETKTGKSNSFLGKLLLNKINFENETSSLNFVTNSGYTFDKNNKLRIVCRDLEAKEIKEIETNLTSELTCKWLDEFVDTIFFETSDLTIDHHEQLAKDKLYRLLESKYTTDVKYNPSLAYRTIFDEVNRKNNLEKKLSNFSELLKYKSISKKDFENILVTIAKEPSNLTNIKNQIFTNLDLAGLKISERRKLISAWKDVEIEYLKIDNEFFKKLVKLLNNLIDKHINVLDDENLIDAIDKIFLEASRQPIIKSQKLYNNEFIKLVILKEIYNG